MVNQQAFADLAGKNADHRHGDTDNRHGDG